MIMLTEQVIEPSPSEFLKMTKQKKDERERREETLKAFRMFDDDKTVKISLKTLSIVARELGQNMTGIMEVQAIIDEADSNKYLYFKEESMAIKISKEHWLEVY